MLLTFVKGANRVISYHDNSVTTALLELFPDIGLERTKFQCMSNSLQFHSVSLFTC